MIELRDVSVMAGGVRILDTCVARLESASVTHLAGANGAGKTTLIRAIAGIQRHSGSICFDGAEAARVRSRLYVCWDDAAVFPYLNGLENIRMLIGRPIRPAAAWSAAPAIADRALLRIAGRRLSHGQRKRIHLVAALLSGADYLLLDEALSGVDAPTVGEVASAFALRVPAATILVTGHHDDAYERVAAQRLVLEDGRLRVSAP